MDRDIHYKGCGLAVPSPPPHTPSTLSSTGEQMRKDKWHRPDVMGNNGCGRTGHIQESKELVAKGRTVIGAKSSVQSRVDPSINSGKLKYKFLVVRIKAGLHWNIVTYFRVP